MLSTDIQTDVKSQKLKERLRYALSFHRSTFSKLELQCKTSMNFVFNLRWYSIQVHIAH